MIVHMSHIIILLNGAGTRADATVGMSPDSMELLSTRWSTRSLSRPAKEECLQAAGNSRSCRPPSVGSL